MKWPETVHKYVIGGLLPKPVRVGGGEGQELHLPKIKQSSCFLHSDMVLKVRLLSSPAVSACCYKMAEGYVPEPGNACGSAVLCRKEDTLEFKERLHSWESVQGNLSPTKLDSLRDPPPHR